MDTAKPADSPSDRPVRSARRRAALIASALAIPVTVVLAFVLSAGGSGGSSKTSTAPLSPVKVAAPPTPSDATFAACTAVFEKLPVQLGTLVARRTDSDSSFVAAWGNPAIVLRCGVAKPGALPDGLDLVDIGTGTASVLWQPDLQKSATVYTTIDRSIYIEVTVPGGQDQPLPLLVDAINSLPATCTGTDAAGNVARADLPICKNAS